MLKRSWISVYKNKGRTIILSVLLFVIANLVLSSITIKAATEEAMDLARISLGAEITLTTNRTEVIDFIRSYRDEYGERPSSDVINSMLLPISSDIAYDLASSPYVVDFNLSTSLNADTTDFYALSSTDALDESGSTKVNLTGTYNPLLLDQFGEYGTYELTPLSSTFGGDDQDVIIISENLAYLNDILIGDTITISNTDSLTQITYTQTLTVIGLFNDTSVITSSSSKISDNEMFIPLTNLLGLEGLTTDDAFTVTLAKYYLDDPLNIDIFVSDATNTYEEISSGSLTFNDVSYDAVIEPIQNVQDFADIFLISVSIGAIIILSLVIFNTLKDRKYEIGVLLSLGEDKVKIIFQYIFEIVLVATLVFSLSSISSNFISDYVGNTLIQSEITQLEADQTETTTSSKGGGSVTMVALENIEYVDELNVSVTIQDFTMTLGIGFIIIILSSAIPSIYITRYNPKTILSSRN